MSPQNVDLLRSLLLPILVLLGIGAIVLVVWLIWAATHPTKSDAPEQTADRDPLRSAKQTTDFLSIGRRNRGEWEIRVAGQSYATLEAVPDPEKRAEVLAALRALATFAGYQPQSTPGQAARRPTGTQPSPLSLSERAKEGEQSEGARQPTGDVAGLAEQAPTNTERDRRLSAAVAATSQERRGAAVAAWPTIDLAHEIGEILDEMLPHRPSLQGHAVTLQNRPGHGIAFVVNGMVYQEIADIPNAEVQALIRDATKEWERR